MLKYNLLAHKAKVFIPTLALIAALVLALAAPAAALAQFSMEDDDAGIQAPPQAAAPGQATVDEEIEEPGEPPWGIVPEDPEVGHVAVVNELMDAHKDLTGIMEAQAGGDYSTPDYPFVMTYVDEENEELVVMMHTMAALAGIEYEEREIQVALDTEADIKITYGTVELDATPVQIESWKQYYRANCLPSYRPGYQTACILYEGYLRENGVDPSSLGTPTAPPQALSMADPCAQSRSSLACYYYTQYKSRCLPTASTSRCATYATQITTAGYALPTSPNPAPAPAPNPAPAPPPLNPAPVPVSGATIFSDGFESGLAAKWVETGEFDWRADSPDEGNPPSRPSSNRVAEADNCDIGCVLTMRSFLNLSSHASATLEFWRYIDTSLDAGEYLRVQVHSGGRWTTVYSWGGGIGDDDRWHREAYSLSSHLTNDFKVRFVAKMSSSSEEVAIDDVAVRGTLRASSDTVPPVVTVPADITRTAQSSAGVAVTYAASARDAVDGSIAPTCLPASGSTFRVGTTTVRCTATDAARNTGSASFRVTVSTVDTAAPILSLPADMTVAATSADGAYITYTATATDAVDGSVTPSCWPASGGRFFVGETTARCSARDSSGNVARASFKVTVTPFSPAPAPGTLVLSEDFEGGLSRWAESGEPDWRTGPHDESYNPDGTRVGTTTNSVATADDCDTGCTLTLARALDLSGRTGATLTFSRFVDRSLDAGEYLRVQVHKGGSWSTIYSWGGGSGDDDRWHHESHGLSSYLVSDFKVRFVARMSSSGEEVAVDNVEVRATGGAPADTVAPVVTVPADISRASASAVAVTYAATARDAVDGAIAPSCSPASGSTFAVGTTTVRCTATDSAGNTGKASFTVTVASPDTTAPVITAPSAMSFTATSAAGATVEYTVTASDAVDGPITPSCSPASGSTFAVGSTTVRCSATDRAGNTARASFTVTVLADATPPAITVPAPITHRTSSLSGLTVSFTVSAHDAVDGTVVPSCTPNSSSTFPIGTTTVTCTATDSSDNSSEKKFDVKIIATQLDDRFEQGMSQWEQLGDANWRSDTPDMGSPPNHSAANKVLEADDCPDHCILTLKHAIDLSGHAGATLEFWRYVEDTLDAGEYLQVEVHSNGWKILHDWTHLSDGLGKWKFVSVGLPNYLSDDFKLRFVAKMDGAGEDVAIDDVRVKGIARIADVAKPVITAPSSISVVAEAATSPDAVVDYTVHAHDAVDGDIVPICTKAGGSRFPVGTTTVRCTATDVAGNRAEVTLAITVNRPPSTSSVPMIFVLRGGMPITATFASTTDSSDTTSIGGTSGLVVQHTNNRPVVIVSSHIVDKLIQGKRLDSVNLSTLGGVNPLVGSTVLATSNVVSNRVVSSDAALVHVTGSKISPSVGTIQKGLRTLTVTDYGASNVPEGATIEILGKNTNSGGTVLYDNVTTKSSPRGHADRVKTGQVAASYWAIPGDSGAPIIHVGSGNQVSFLGVHVGAAKTAFIESSGAVVVQGGASANQLPSDERRNLLFSIFSPWENIQSDLRIPCPVASC